MSNFATAAVISTFDYKYDAVGNPSRVAEASGDRVTWSYDKIYQLRRERRNGATAYDVTHSYDAVGNRTVKTDSGARTTASYDAANQILVAKTASSRTTFSHDNAGNRTRQNAAGSLTSLAWDVDSRMRRTVVPAGTIQTIAYTGDHKRVSQQDASGTGRYIWDGPNLLTETDSGGATQAVYTQGQNPPGEDFGELLSQRRGSTTSYAHFTALGTTDRLTNSSQTVADSYILGAFADQKASTGRTTNPHRFIGELGYYQDAATGMYYVRRRWYDPATARWVSEDPIGLRGRDSSYYRYSANRPLMQSDPSGLQTGTRRIDPDFKQRQFDAIRRRARERQARVCDIQDHPSKCCEARVYATEAFKITGKYHLCIEAGGGGKRGLRDLQNRTSRSHGDTNQRGGGSSANP